MVDNLHVSKSINLSNCRELKLSTCYSKLPSYQSAKLSTFFRFKVDMLHSFRLVKLASCQTLKLSTYTITNMHSDGKLFVKVSDYKAVDSKVIKLTTHQTAVRLQSSLAFRQQSCRLRKLSSFVTAKLLSNLAA